MPGDRDPATRRRRAQGPFAAHWPRVTQPDPSTTPPNTVGAVRQPVSTGRHSGPSAMSRRSVAPPRLAGEEGSGAGKAANPARRPTAHPSPSSSPRREAGTGSWSSPAEASGRRSRCEDGVLCRELRGKSVTSRSSATLFGKVPTRSCRHGGRATSARGAMRSVCRGGNVECTWTEGGR